MLSVILDIILIILKIIGIGLLCLLGLVIALLLIVLFVPIRYKSYGSFKKNDEGFKFAVSGGVTWLLHIISVRFEIKDKQSDFVIKIFGKRLNAKSDSANNKAKKEKKQKKKKHIEEKTVIEDKPTSKTISSNEKFISDDNLAIKNNTNQIASSNNSDNINDKSISDDLDNKTEEKTKKSFKEKIANIFSKIDKLCDKVKHINDVKNSFIDFLKKEDSKVAIKELKHIIFKVIKHILPTKLKGRLHFGLKDPASTGNVLGIASIFYGIYGDKLILEPDFENEVLDGEYELKGRIRMFTLLIAAFKIYRNKWLKGFMAFSKNSVKDL